MAPANKRLASANPSSSSRHKPKRKRDSIDQLKRDDPGLLSMSNESFKRPEQVNAIRLTCPYGCPGTFKNELTLMLHYNELHGVQGRPRNQPQQAEQNNGSQKAFQCPEPGCSMSSDKMKSVRSHMKRDHRGNSRLRWPYSHTGCAKDYANWYDLQTHIESKHSGGAPSRFKWTSVGCPGDYANQSNLNQHL